MTELSNSRYPLRDYQSWVTYVEDHNPTNNFKPATEPAWWYNRVSHELYVYMGSRVKKDASNNFDGYTYEWSVINMASSNVIPPPSDSITFVDNAGAVITAGTFTFENTVASGIAVSVQDSNDSILISVRDGGITTNHIQNNAVTVDKLASMSVLTEKIQNGAVTAEKLSSALQTSINVTLPSKISLDNLNDSDTIQVVKTGSDASFEVKDSSIGVSKLTQNLLNRIDSDTSTPLQYNNEDVTSVSEGSNIDLTLTNGNLQIASTATSGGTAGVTIDGTNRTTLEDSSTVEWTGTAPNASPEVVDNSIGQDQLTTDIVQRIDSHSDSYMLPAVLQDIADSTTITHETEGGTWQRRDPDPYFVDRGLTIDRIFAVFEDGENRTSSGANQITGNTFTDVTPQISLTTTDPQYHPAGLTPPQDAWPERTSYDRGKVVVENSDSNTTPLTNTLNKIAMFDVRIQDVNNYPTTSTPLLTFGADDAHPMYTMQRVGSFVNISVETISSRSPGSTTYTRINTLNANRRVIPGMVGGETQQFVNLPDDWDSDDHIEFRFSLYQVSRRETFFPEVTLTPSDTGFDVAELTTSVPETTFTVTFNVVDGQTPLTLSTTYHAEYRAERNANGAYFIEFSNASLTQNLGSDYEAHVFVDRASAETHGSTNNYTSQQILALSSGQSRTIVSTFYPNDDTPLTNQSARLQMTYADSNDERNNIDLDRAIGEDGLDFSRVVYNDVAVTNATFVSRMEYYSYSGQYPPSHNNLRMMWQNRGNYLGLFIDQARNVETITFHAIVKSDNTPVGEIHIGENEVVTPDTDGIINITAGNLITLSKDSNSDNTLIIASTASSGGGGTTTALMYNGQNVATVSVGASITASYDSVSENLSLAVTNPTTIDTVQVSDGTALTPASRTIRFVAGDNISITRDPTNANHAVITATDNDTEPNIQSISVDGTAVVPDSNKDINLVAGTNVSLDVSGKDITINSTATGGGGSGGSKDVSTSTFTVTDGTVATGGTAGTFTTYQWYSGGRSRSVTVDYDGSKTVDGVEYIATPDAYSGIGSAWETTATQSSSNISTLFDIRGGGRRLYRASGFSNPTSIRDLNDFSSAHSSTGDNPLFIANFTSSTSTFPPTSSSNTQSVLVEIRRSTANINVFELVFQQVLTDPTYVRLPDIEADDILIVALPTANQSTRVTLRFRRQLTAPVPATDASAGDTSKTSSTATETFDMLSFDSEAERDSVVNKARLLSEETRVVVDPEILPFLFLERTLESLSVSVHDDDLDEFIDNPIFSIKESVYRQFLVDGTTNIRIIRTRGNTRETVDDTLSFEARGTVDNATSTIGGAINEPYYCVRATFDVQDNDIFEIEGHTSKNFSVPTLRYQNQEVLDLTIGEGIDPVYTPLDKRLDLSATPGFDTFILRLSGSPVSGVGIQLRKSDSPYNEYVTWSPIAIDIDTSSVTASSYIQQGIFTGNKTSNVLVSGRYRLRPQGSECAIIVAPSTQTGFLRRIFSRRAQTNTDYYVEMFKNNLLSITPAQTINDSSGRNLQPYDLDNFSVTVNTAENPQLDEFSEIWYSFSFASFPQTAYVSTTMLDIGSSIQDVSDVSGISIRHVEVDADHANTSLDIDNIFNFISLTSSELTALNMTSNGYTDGKIFFEFKNDGNFILHTTASINTYLLHIRPTRTNGLITGYTRIFSAVGNYIQRSSNDDTYLEALAGDLLLIFHSNSSTTTSQDLLFSIGQVINIGANPDVTYLKYQLESATFPNNLTSIAFDITRFLIDFDNSDSNFSNIFRHFVDADFVSGNTVYYIRTYNIARFKFVDSITLSTSPYITEWPVAIFGGNPGNNDYQSFGSSERSLGVSNLGVGSNRTVFNDDSTGFMGITNLQLASAEYDASLIQETSVSTNFRGIKYPNNGYDTALSSSNITDIFNLKSLTLAEMQILTDTDDEEFSATGNMVLEAKISGVMTFRALTTSETVASSFALFSFKPTYENNILTSVVATSSDLVQRSEGTVDTVTADSNGIWHSPFVTVKAGDLFYIQDVGRSGTANAIAINFVQE